ncbi:MAG: cupredoxin domain-containing protein [Chloroflexota bacterium]
MANRTTLRGHRFGIAAAALLIGLSSLLAGCDVIAGNRPKLVLEIRSQQGEGVAYDPESVTARARTLIAVSFVNVSTLDHNLVFLDPLAVGTEEIVGPGESAGLEFVTPGPGQYGFVCTIHEGMRGSLLVR